MARTPGYILPTAYSSDEELVKDLRRRDEAAGFTPFESSDFVDDIVEHVGVKGMKWGQRKNDTTTSETKPARRIKSKREKQLTVAAGALAVGSILHASGTLKPTASFAGGYAVKGAAFVANAILNGAITVVVTTHNLIT